MLSLYARWLGDHPKMVWGGLGMVSVAVAILAVVLGVWLELTSCYLCVFQRVLFMGLGLFFILAAVVPWGGLRRGMILLAGITTLGGVAVSAFQSWDQWFPKMVGGCSAPNPNLIERFVWWLGQFSSTLFSVNGSCEERDLVILGLSLANWSFVLFAGFAVMIYFVSSRRYHDRSTG